MSENEKPNFYAIIPANVRYDKRLKPIARLLYGEITALCNEKGYCWASNSYFANLYEVANETISRYIAQLKEYGYIQIVYEKKEQNIEKRKIYILYSQNCQGGIDRTVKENNTINNIKNNTGNNKQPPDFQNDSVYDDTTYNTTKDCFEYSNYDTKKENEMKAKIDNQIDDINKAISKSPPATAEQVLGLVSAGAFDKISDDDLKVIELDYFKNKGISNDNIKTLLLKLLEIKQLNYKDLETILNYLRSYNLRINFKQFNNILYTLLNYYSQSNFRSIETAIKSDTSKIINTMEKLEIAFNKINYKLLDKLYWFTEICDKKLESSYFRRKASIDRAGDIIRTFLDEFNLLEWKE